jgi:hypothetical protein
MKNEAMKTLLKECDEQIAKATIPAPDSSFLWTICLLFFIIILFPFLVFPLLSKIDSVKPYLNGIDMSKFDALLSKNSVHILFYALPAAIVVTHGVSVSAWKTSVSESMRLRMYKLAVLRVTAVLETKEWFENEDIRKLMLERAFDVGLTSLTITPEEKIKPSETGVPTVDLVLKSVDKIEKHLSSQSTLLTKS